MVDRSDDTKQDELRSKIASAVAPILEQFDLDLPQEFAREGHSLDPAKSLRLWRAMLQLREELIADEDLAQLADRDPVELSRALDLRLLELRNEPATDEARLAQIADSIALLNSLTPAQRQRIVDLTGRLPPTAACTLVLVCAAAVKVAVAVQNTNVGANANAGANANCLSNVNGCSFQADPFGPLEVSPQYRFRMLRVELPPTFLQSEFHQHMSAANLSIPRQKELLRRTLMEPGGLLRADDLAAQGRAIYTFNGATFEVRAHVDGDAIVIDEIVMLGVDEESP